MKSILLSILALGVAFGACAQEAEMPAVVDKGGDGGPAPESAEPSSHTGVAGVTSAPSMGGIEIAIGEPVGDSATSAPRDASVPGGSGSTYETIGISAEQVPDSRFSDWLDSMRISLKHEVSYKFASPKRLVNNRSSVRVEYSDLFGERVFLRLDSKLNLYWGRDHRAKARDEDYHRELVTREAYLQTSFGNTSLRLGYQILPWGVSEGGAITDEISPRNSSEFFFVSLEESRIGQPMVTADHFSDSGQWTAFFVPRPAYNQYPNAGSEYDIAGAFEVPEPERSWTEPDDFEYGFRWKRTFGKSDFSLMAASLIDNDYLVRKQRFQMYGLTANVARDNLLYRAEVALKQPRAFFAQAAADSELSIVESDEFDSSLGFDYSPGGGTLMYSAEFIWNRLLDWKETIVGRERDEYSLVGSVTNTFMNDELSLTWLAIYSEPYAAFQHKFLSSYLIDDSTTLYFELFFPDVRDERSGSWPYRDQKQFVVRYRYQF